MSELSVNEHLEGILSDFEALKKSFEIEDVDDISLAPPISSPIPPPSSRFYLDHKNKTTGGNSGGSQSPSLAFNRNNNNFAGHRSCTSLNSSPSTVLKSRTVASSMSFNRGTVNKSALHHNGSSVARASSFQSKLNPTSYSMFSGPGSDSDSLHSSTSSLEYTGSGGGALSHAKLGSYPSPSSQGEHHRTQRHPQVAKLVSNSNLTKLSSHGSVFHTEVDHGMMVGLLPPQEMNHGSMPTLDIQIRNGGGGIVGGLPRGCNGHHSNDNSAEGEGHHAYKYEQSPQVVKSPPPKAKEIPRLNKFPLDLDNLVSSTATSPTKADTGFLNTKQSPKSTGGLFQHHSSPPTPVVPPLTPAPSASISSLESSSDTLPQSQPYFSSSSPTPLQESFPSPESPKLKVPKGLQLAPMVLTSPSPAYSPSSPPNPRAIRPLENCTTDTRESVGSILQRIASFSRPVAADTTQQAVTSQIPTDPGWSSSSGRSPVIDVPSPSNQQGKMNYEELETRPLTPMEEAQERGGVILGQEHKDVDKSEDQAATLTLHNSQTEKQEEEEEKEECPLAEKGMEEGEMRKEVEMEEGKEESVPGQQISFIRGTDMFGYVGIEAVLDQMRHKTMKAGFEFNIMVVGQSGLGKSTLVNTLFKSKVSRKSCTPSFEEGISKTVRLHSVSHVIEEKGVKMKLTVIDTPGFGDQINNENCWEPIVMYINEQYEKYLREELHVLRQRHIPDTRVHCCIYFLPATGHRLRPIDVEFMRRLGTIVSVVPVIAKADTLTIEERQEFKERIRQDLTANGIRVYPQKELDEDVEEHIVNDRIRENIPFAVVGTDQEHQVNGNKVLGRKTKWGIIEVENVAHCEFANLRDLLIRSHLQDLKDVTHHIHYESYRVRRLNESNMDFSQLGVAPRPQENGGGDRYDTESHL